MNTGREIVSSMIARSWGSQHAWHDSGQKRPRPRWYTATTTRICYWVNLPLSMCDCKRFFSSSIQVCEHMLTLRLHRSCWLSWPCFSPADRSLQYFISLSLSLSLSLFAGILSLYAQTHHRQNLLECMTHSHLSMRLKQHRPTLLQRWVSSDVHLIQSVRVCARFQFCVFVCD